MKTNILKFFINLSILICVVGAFSAANLQAATFVVTSSGTGAGSFAEAVTMANNSPTDDVITFADPVSPSYDGGVIIAANGSLTIQGRGAEAMKISDDTEASSYAVLRISQNATVILNDITVADGLQGIYLGTGADLTLNNSVIRNNGFTSDSGAGGGAIYAVGSNYIQINDSTIRNNGIASDENASGGAIIGFSGVTLEINRSVVRNNAARGGIDIDIANERNSTESPEGSSVGSGGAIYIGGTLIVNDSVITDNLCNGSGGAISLFGTATIRRSVLSENQSGGSGGAIVGGRVNMTNSLVLNNSAYRGGGIYASVGHISNTTISGNEASFGGGIRNGGSSNSSGVILRNVTITNNTAYIEGGGIAPIFDDTITDIGNTIVAGNTSPDGKNIKGTIVSSGYNIIGNTSGATVIGDQTGNRLNTDPLLAPLADNGGDSMTHRLLPNSPAINAGNNALAVDFEGNPLEFDQRGTPFQRIVGNRVDIGAFELQTAFVNTKTLFDFDGDGQADKVVFRPSDGNWYLLTTDIGITSVNFGAPTDKIVPADYDADGKTDIAVFRDGFWYILKSTNNQFFAVQFGQADDIPVPADYDADGKDDVAVFRDGSWYILNSSDGSFRAENFGQAGDEPIIGDFDADGKSDLTVFREGFWYILQSQNGFRAENFGAPTDIPVAADYDGDAKTDIAVYRDGFWYINGSATGFSAVQFGNITDKPVPADYDGDGKTDVAVYRGGIWYVSGTTNGFNAVQFGAPNDIPAPNAFKR